MKDVFEKIAPSGEISVDDLLARFDLKTNDAYRNGEKSAKEVLAQVADLFDQNQDGKVTWTEFVDAHVNVSPNFAQD